MGKGSSFLRSLSFLLLLCIVVQFVNSQYNDQTKMSSQFARNKIQSFSDVNSLFSVENVMTHLRALENIAYEFGNGNRAAGTTGYNASADYVVEYLKSNTNFTVTVQPFSYYNFAPISEPILKQISPSEVSYLYDEDFTALKNSGSGELTAAIQYSASCCSASDFENFVAGNIAVCDYEGCTIEVKVNLSISYSSAAVFIINPIGEGVDSGTLDDPVDCVVFGLRHEIGNLIISTSPTPTFYVKREAKLTVEYTSNIIADVPSDLGDESSVVIFGCHLDSVVHGPGINDDGSGSAAMLELTRSFSMYLNSHKIVNKIRVIWFGAEELGKVGSRYYVNQLKSTNTLSSVLAYYNFDMIGSPNFYRGIYNGNTAPENLQYSSTKLQEFLTEYFEFSNLTYRLISFGGGSDYYYFLESGIAASGLHTGASTLKPPIYRTLFGGIALAGFDPCYHDICDTVDNISQIVIEENGKASLYAATEISKISNLSRYLYSPSSGDILLLKARTMQTEILVDQFLSF